jgi:uncharacterized protein (TIGR00255 family)
MIASMTGYGRAEARAHGLTATVELRGVNSRYLEVSARLPRSLSRRENDVKEALRSRISRGKLTVTVNLERESDGDIPLSVNVQAARAYHKLLNDLRKAVRSTERVRLAHLLQFPEVFESREADATDEREWTVARKALDAAADMLHEMRTKEGAELANDFRARLSLLEQRVEEVERLSRGQVPRERTRLRERIGQLLEQERVDEGRLEMELTMLADRLDVTEECVRFRSHTKFFREAIDDKDPAGRKLNFLVQEMNREVNTMGSKSNDTGIAHLVVGMKEELEKIREQLQNIE